MADILVGFGDSWAHGDEINCPEENSYLALLGKKLGMPVKNFSTNWGTRPLLMPLSP
jgi:hypothetical protein